MRVLGSRALVALRWAIGARVQALCLFVLAACGARSGVSPGNVLRQWPPPPGVAMRIHLIDVGQGAATLLEFSCAAVLIDTGGEENDDFHSRDRIVDYLESFFEQRPDLDRTLAALYLTHPHIDHTRAVREVVEEFSVRNIVTNGQIGSSGGRQQRWLKDDAEARGLGQEAVTHRQLVPDGHTSPVIDPVSCRDVDPRFRVLWGTLERWDAAGWSTAAFTNANNHSVVLRVDVGSVSFLVTGDLEEAGIEDLLRLYEGTGTLDVDIYQVGHHGSKNATTPELLDAITPSMALISAGAPSRRFMWTAWAYGHPSEGIVKLLEETIDERREVPKTVEVGTSAKTFTGHLLEKAIYSTAWDGTVLVDVMVDGEMRVHAER